MPARLGRQEAKLLDHLLSDIGEWVPRHQLIEALGHPRAVEKAFHRIRSKLGPEIIETTIAYRVPSDPRIVTELRQSLDLPLRSGGYRTGRPVGRSS